MVDLVTFGEAMVRLSPPNFMRLEQTPTLELNVGGTELNVAVGASRLGLRTAWVSKLPANPLGRMIANKAREHGVDTGHVVWEPGGRAGLYFLELGATPRPSSVLYDRAASAFSHLRPGEIDWDAVLSRAKCLHLTGITPAVSASAADATLEALGAARQTGCKVSMDLNYRRKLWDPETARRTLLPLLDYVDILITAPGDTHTVLGIATRDPNELAGVLCDRFPLEVAAVTVRQGDSVWQCRWTAVARAGSAGYATRVFDIDKGTRGPGWVGGMPLPRGFFTGTCRKPTSSGAFRLRRGLRRAQAFHPGGPQLVLPGRGGTAPAGAAPGGQPLNPGVRRGCMLNDA